MDAPLEINRDLSIPRDELVVTFARSGGPGGQNVNKVSSKVVLRFAVATSPTLNEDQRARILAKSPPRYLTKDGELVIAASEYRDQAQNRAAAEKRLVSVLRDSLVVERPRHATKPGKGARARKRDAKKRLSEKKSARRGGWE